MLKVKNRRNGKANFRPKANITKVKAQTANNNENDPTGLTQAYTDSIITKNTARAF